MTTIVKKKDAKPYQEHPRIKICYLRNDLNSIKKQSTLPNHLIGPSISCLSSLIQKDKDTFQIDNVQSYVKKGEMIDENLREGGSDRENGSFTYELNRRQRKISQTEGRQHYKRNAFTSELRKENHSKNSITQSASKPKRFIKSSQQQAHLRPLNQNNQALQKDFLCNIVKEWNAFTQRDKTQLSKSPLKKWKRSIDSHHRAIKADEIEELKKNKSLMKEHFHLFLQNQRVKNMSKKQNSIKLFKAVFNKEKTQHQTSSNDHVSSINVELKDLYHQRDKRSSIQTNGNKHAKMERRFSLNQKSQKNQYLRLLYGPEVKLIPRLFEEKGKMKNFQWEKLDNEVYESRRKRKGPAVLLNE